jgi:hypothetical protein
MARAPPSTRDPYHPEHTQTVEEWCEQQYHEMVDTPDWFWAILRGEFTMDELMDTARPCIEEMMVEELMAELFEEEMHLFNPAPGAPNNMCNVFIKKVPRVGTLRERAEARRRKMLLGYRGPAAGYRAAAEWLNQHGMPTSFINTPRYFKEGWVEKCPSMSETQAQFQTMMELSAARHAGSGMPTLADLTGFVTEGATTATTNASPSPAAIARAPSVISISSSPSSPSNPSSPRTPSIPNTPGRSSDLSDPRSYGSPSPPPRPPPSRSPSQDEVRVYDNFVNRPPDILYGTPSKAKGTRSRGRGASRSKTPVPARASGRGRSRRRRK